MAQNKNNNSVGPFLFGVLAGGIAGAALALLFAPAEGREVRQGISEKLDDITDSVNRILSSAKTSADKAFNEGRERGERLIGTARERVGSLIEDADRTITEARRRGTNGSASNGMNANGDDVAGSRSQGDEREGEDS